MADRDPLEILARVAHQPTHPDVAFAERLLEELLVELTSGDDATASDDPGGEPVPVLDPREDAPMSTKRWTWAAAAAVAAVVLAVVLVAIATRGDDDTVIVDQPPSTVENPPAPTSAPSTPADGDGAGRTWCARTTSVLADVDDDGDVHLEAMEAWVDDAPPEMAETARTYAELVGTAPVIRAADPDFETEFEDARAAIDAYVADNC